MKKIYLLVTLLTLQKPVFCQDTLSPATSGPRWAGWAILGAEYIGGPVVASQYWWQNGFGRNPLANIGEQEPYAEDKMWHFWNGENLTDLHYWTLKKYLGKDSPGLAMGLTFTTLTGIELLDGSDSDGKWKFSLWDEAADIGGIALWYLKHKYPGRVPLEVRVGIRRWDKFFLLFKRAAQFSSTFNTAQYGWSHMDNYSIFKTEVIIRPKSYWYGGLAISCKTDSNGVGIPENLYGATAGFDVMRYYANRKPGRFTPWVNAFGRYLSLSLSHTHWFER
jgi:hypothetical protein